MTVQAARFGINEYVLIGFGLLVFGLLGFRRGVNRELLTFGAVLVGLAISALLGDVLVPAVNRLARIVSFALGGGLSGSGGAWLTAQQRPDLVSSPESRKWLGLVLFGLPILLSYWVGMRLARPVNFGQRLLGFLVGCLTGFFVARKVQPVLFPSGVTSLVLNTGQTGDILQNTQVVAVAVVISVVVLVAFGLYSARRPVVKK
ncbi:MAG: hypothetical protein GXY52_00815 [Chloroflexi bacterium]|nr:hypothetical protein [Chloroflexota bacterium]